MKARVFYAYSRCTYVDVDVIHMFLVSVQLRVTVDNAVMYVLCGLPCPPLH